MTRTTAREIAVQLGFSLVMTEQFADELLDEVLVHVLKRLVRLHVDGVAVAPQALVVPESDGPNRRFIRRGLVVQQFYITNGIVIH